MYKEECERGERWNTQKRNERREEVDGLRRNRREAGEWRKRMKNEKRSIGKVV